jgi:3-deoxy-D-arabino-heptulosonate 7-phosphate (DAHP) synthase
MMINGFYWYTHIRQVANLLDVQDKRGALAISPCSTRTQQNGKFVYDKRLTNAQKAERQNGVRARAAAVEAGSMHEQ